MWYIAWIFFVYESPSCHPTISDEEKETLEKTTVTESEVNLSGPNFPSLNLKELYLISVA